LNNTKKPSGAKSPLDLAYVYMKSAHMYIHIYAIYCCHSLAPYMVPTVPKDRSITKESSNVLKSMISPYGKSVCIHGEILSGYA